MHAKAIDIHDKKQTVPRPVRRIGKLFALALFATAAVFSTGCATKTQNGALIGTGIGAGLGAVVGHQSGHAGEGALIGGAAGALTGGIIGNQMDKNST
jgi:uncharacterized protein YcfJ